MKTKKIWIATSLITLLATSAFADSSGTSNFKATNGTQFTMNWQASYNFNQQQGIGINTVNSIEISVSQGPGSQVVFLNICKDPSGKETSQISKCDLQPLNNESSATSCSIQGGIIIEKDFEGAASSNVSCRQQIAIVMKDNTWLVDPISRQHNFNFTIN